MECSHTKNLSVGLQCCINILQVQFFLQFNIRHFIFGSSFSIISLICLTGFSRQVGNLNNHMNEDNTKYCKMNSNQDPLQENNSYNSNTESVQYQISSKLLCLVYISSWSTWVLQDHSLKEAISSCLVGQVYHNLLSWSNQHLLNNGHEKTERL